jgi:hypothetical protein
MTMDADGRTCVKCGAPLPGSPGAGAALALALPEHTCPVCGTRQIVCRFPALARRQTRASNGARAQDGEAACFHHPGHQAEAVCDACGRFLCALCNIDFNGRALCPACLSLTQSAAADAHIPRRTRYDRLALLCILLSPLVYCLSFVNAGVALFLCVRYWKRPLSILPRNRWRFVVSGVLAVALLALWIGIAGAFLLGIKDHIVPNEDPQTEVSDDR